MGAKSGRDQSVGPFPVMPGGAEQITGFLKSALQTERVAILIVGRLLDQVRKDKLYAELKHADLESYAKDRLQLGRSSLYHYLHVFDWVSKHHPEWIHPEPGVVIPDLDEVSGLMWIEQKLSERGLNAPTRSRLNELKEKALTGKLTRAEFREVKGRSLAQTRDSRIAYLAELRALRKKGDDVPELPEEFLTNFDDLIAMLQNAINAPRLSLLGKGKPRVA